ncbi:MULTISPECIES: hypothetical protein [unclassified Pseudomonas]|uniref:hypothetical protein n=1 Tax=unclassified Pseudomonas TaxID=196821 RepID=UPI000AA9A2E0|nr:MULTISPECIES: hypothetical protein [unclassified Pseudomonas]QOF85685.1 hypothetical protein IG194_02985 [Pseudomonas sp. ADPe]
MLHAITQNKSRLHLRYLGHREEGEHRVAEEDEITALLMGPLSFLPSTDIAAFWQAIVEGDWPADQAHKADMHFWKKRNGLEPDLFVELEWPNGTRRVLLVEFKWRSGLSGARQLHEQWENCLDETEKTQAFHLFIAPEVSAGQEALTREDIWKGRLLLRSWTEVLARCPNTSVSLIKWREQMEIALKKLRIQPFLGFPKLPASASLQQYLMHLPALYEQCYALRDSLKQVFHELPRNLSLAKLVSLADDNLRRESQRESWQEDSLGCFYQSLAYSMPIRLGRRKTPSHLFFQISLAGDGMQASGNAEPLLHIGLWNCPINFHENQYMGFPVGGYAPTSIDHDVLMRWGKQEWLYTLKLLDLDPQDIQTSIAEPVKSLLLHSSAEQALPTTLEGLVRYGPDATEGQYRLTFQSMSTYE